MTTDAAPLKEAPLYGAFHKMKEKDYPSAQRLLEEGLEQSSLRGDGQSQAIYLSVLGVLAKLKGDHREAWRCYEKAEKLLPDDPSLKIIMANLLIDQFSQYDTAIKKLQQVLKLAKGCDSFEHQAHAGLAIAYLKKGDKKKAALMLDLSMQGDFKNVSTAENINLEVIEAFLGRQCEVARCKDYVVKAQELAKRKNESRPLQFFNKLLESFEMD